MRFELKSSVFACPVVSFGKLRILALDVRLCAVRQVAAPEGRKKSAHGVSRGVDRANIKPRRGDRVSSKTIVLSPRRGLAFSPTHPRLKPWASFFRCPAANRARAELMSDKPVAPTTTSPYKANDFASSSPFPNLWGQARKLGSRLRLCRARFIESSRFN